MIKETLIFGPPGCGKTHTLIDIVRKHLENNGNPERIGFVSFSKKSVMEARDRISKDLTPKQIPWFRTLHSIGYQWLGMKDENMMTKYDFNKLGQELGLTFAYKVNANAVTELNLLGNLGNASYRQAGDLYGIILLPESATGADIEDARKLLIDRGAADGVTVTDLSNFWRLRADIVQFHPVDTSSGTNFSNAWNGNNLTSFPTRS